MPVELGILSAVGKAHVYLTHNLKYVLMSAKQCLEGTVMLGCWADFVSEQEEKMLN